MKKQLLLILFSLALSAAYSQNPTYQQKLFYTCKVWGFAKYYHSEVSTCQVNWDSVLVRYLPSIKNAVTSNDFNNVLDSMLAAAGPMAIATTPPPATLPVELSRNLNFAWTNDPALRADIQIILDTIINNFRPHTICWVQENTTSSGGWLVFPFDNPMLNVNSSVNYPDEWNRLLVLFKYWNILNYFNPNKYVLDVSWDTTLYQFDTLIAFCPDPVTFSLLLRQMGSNLDDAHTEGLHYNSNANFNINYRWPDYFSPRIVLKRIPGQYIVAKSSVAGITRGDELIMVDGKSMQDIEDSLRPFVSAGDSSVFRLYMSQYMLRGALSSNITLTLKDSLGVTYTQTTTRTTLPANSFFTSYYPNDTLDTVAYTEFPCGVGYVNMGVIQHSDVPSMYAALQSTTAIIFDIRNYPSGTAWPIADLMYAAADTFARATLPDATYPGTFSWEEEIRGVNGNPNPYTGQVIILVDEQTISHAEFSAMIFRHMPGALVVGSQTAGADGDISYFYTTNDQMVGFSTLGIYYPNGDSTQRIGIVPDSVCYPTQEGLRHGRDEVLETALGIVGCGLSTPEVVSTGTAFSVYPNPAGETITIEGDAAKNEVSTISITDITGRTVFQHSAVFHADGTMTIDVSELAPGAYVITIAHAEGSTAMKFVKE